MNLDATPKLAIITGAGHRLGSYFALTLAQRGYAILLHYHSSDSKVSDLIMHLKSFGSQVYPIKADLMNTNQIYEMWSTIDTLPHRVEILINSAAIMPKNDILTMSQTDFDRTMELNLRAPLICSQEAAKRMSGGGLIINISDIGAGKNWLSYPAYSISKAALEVLTRLLAKALAPNIRVNAIAPGLVIPPENGNDDLWESLIKKVPLRRAAASEEITSMLEYLITNKYITGQVITIDGGYSL
jgi:pteridine reductase